MNSNWISTLNAVSGAWANAIWRATWQGALFIAIVWIICRLFKGMPAATRSLLWWIASLQLLIRLAVVTPFAVPILPSRDLATSSAMESKAPELFSRGRVFQIPLAEPTTSQAPMPALTQAVETVTDAPLSVVLAEPSPHLTVASIALCLWILGVFTCLSVSGRRLLGTRRLLRGAREVQSGPAYDLVQEFSIDHGVKQPRLLESELALCPLLAGWHRPAIVLPTRCSEQLSASQLKMAVAHELAHLQRHDLWLGIVPALTQSIFFFHPLGWLATHEGAASREAACDAEALRITGGSPAAYARLLLDTAQSRSSMAVLGTAFGFRLIQRRISMLNTVSNSNPRRFRSTWSLLIALGAVCALPWTVTAQVSPPQPTAPAKASKPKPSKKRKSPIKVAKLTKLAATPARRNVGLVALPPFPANRIGLMPVPDAPMAISPRANQGVAPFRFAPQAVTAPTAPFPSRPGFAPRAAVSVPAPIPPRRSSSGLSELPPQATVAAPAPQIGQFTTPVRSDEEAAISVDTNNVRLDHAELHKALQKFFESRRISYTIKSDVLTDTVTCSLANMSVDGALKLILASVKQPLTYRVEDGVYTIIPKNGSGE